MKPEAASPGTGTGLWNSRYNPTVVNKRNKKKKNCLTCFICCIFFFTVNKSNALFFCDRMIVAINWICTVKLLFCAGLAVFYYNEFLHVMNQSHEFSVTTQSGSQMWLVKFYRAISPVIAYINCILTQISNVFLNIQFCWLISVLRSFYLTW